jgi:hypothetical protein
MFNKQSLYFLAGTICGPKVVVVSQCCSSKDGEKGYSEELFRFEISNFTGFCLFRTKKGDCFVFTQGLNICFGGVA